MTEPTPTYEEPWQFWHARALKAEAALLAISKIENAMDGDDWCEIDEARGIADAHLAELSSQDKVK